MGSISWVAWHELTATGLVIAGVAYLVYSYWKRRRNGGAARATTPQSTGGGANRPNVKE